MRKSLQTDDTIFSLASGRLPSAVGVEKLSGPRAFEIAAKLFRPAGEETFSRSRGMFFGTLGGVDGKFRDEVLLLSFIAPYSHTGQDVIEIHCHGSRAIIEALESDLISLGARPAEKGEFTYRALLNGKTTPEKVEELGDLFQATRPIDLNQIYSRRENSLVQEVEKIRSHLIRIRAILETAIDFSDEYSGVLKAIHEPVRLASHECSLVIQRYSTVKSLGNEPRIVLAGSPNAGKSSLFNSLLGRYRSIVREEPGTTRDVLEETIELSGRPWRMVDTAGVRDGGHSIEQEGIELARQYLASASFWILVVDGSLGWGDFDRKLLEDFKDVPHLVIWNKSDKAEWKRPRLEEPLTIFPLSTQMSVEVVQFAQALSSRLESLVGVETSVVPTVVQARRLERVVERLQALELAAQEKESPEGLAERSREVLSHLEDVIGEVTLEDVLDRVFSEFCIGK